MNSNLEGKRFCTEGQETALLPGIETLTYGREAHGVVNIPTKKIQTPLSHKYSEENLEIIVLFIADFEI